MVPKNSKKKTLNFESEKIQVKGFVARHICQKPSNWRSQKSLDQFLAEEGIPSIEGIDTRMLTKKSRIHGTMKAMLKVYNSNESININQIKNDLKKYPDITKINFINKIKKNTVRNIKSTGKFKVILIGVFKNLLKPTPLFPAKTSLNPGFPFRKFEKAKTKFERFFFVSSLPTKRRYLLFSSISKYLKISKSKSSLASELGAEKP